MRKILLVTTGLAMSLAMVLMNGCTPSADQLKAALLKNPEIVFAVIEENPEKFMDVVNVAFQKSQLKQKEKEAAEQEAAREAEYKNPLVPNIEEGRAIKGPVGAPITIVSYSDFQCPYCVRGYQTLRALESKYKDKIRLVFKHLPLQFHDKAMPAAQWYEAIAMQNGEKAYQFHDKLFENQDKLKVKEMEPVIAFFKETAKSLGLDVAKVETDANSEKVKARIAADMAEASKFKFEGTPGFLVNGISIKGAVPPAEFEKIIDRLLTEKAK